MTKQLEKTITIGGDKILVKRIIVGNLTEVTAAVDPFLSEFEKIVKKSDGSFSKEDLFRLAGYHVSHMVTLCIVLTDKDRAYLESMDPDDFVDLMAEVVVYCGDFFLKKWINPLIKMNEKLKLAFLTSLIHSSQQGMVTKQ